MLLQAYVSKNIYFGLILHMYWPGEPTGYGVITDLKNTT
jgi:hypothetical protein